MAEMKVMMRAVMLVVRPHMSAVTMEAKLSSIRMISEASLATLLPVIPMEKPTSAALRAAPSLVLSPVTATTS